MDQTTLSPDSELLARFVQSRDEAAFGELVQRYESVVLAAAVRRTGSADLARDVAQQVFVALARKADRLLKHGRLGGWLYKAASFEASRVIQAEDRMRRRQAVAAEDSIVPAAAPDARWAALEDALAALGNGEREVIVMHYFKDRSYAEIATDLGLKEPAVRKRVSRAVSKLGAELTRRGVATPAVSVLAAAVALQTQVPVQAGTAVQALATAATTSTTVGVVLPVSITAPLMIKTATITIVLAAIPLCWQWSENRALSRELERVQDSAGVEQPPGPIVIANTSAEGNLRTQASAMEAQLAALQTDRDAARARLAALEAGADRIRDEVVMAFGNVDDVASSIARVYQLSQVLDSETNDDSTKSAAAAELFKLMPSLSAAAQGLLRMDEDPEMGARFLASVVANLGELDDESRGRIEQAVIPHLAGMEQEGLVFANRPESQADRDRWEARHHAAATKAMNSIKPHVPEEALQSEWWDSFFGVDSLGYLNMLHQFADNASVIQYIETPESEADKKGVVPK